MISLVLPQKNGGTPRKLPTYSLKLDYIKTESLPATISHTTHLGINPRTPSTPTTTDKKDEKFQKYARWMVAISAFETDPVLKKRPIYAGKRPTGCAYCNTDTHFFF